MEEDIKIVEELVRNNYLEDLGYLRDNNHYIRFNQALENLIKGYRELEECLEVTSKSLNNVAYDQIPLAIQDLKVSSIPKSKVKEKIEEYQLNMKKYEYADKNIFNENNIRQEVITVLTELLMEDK